MMGYFLFYAKEKILGKRLGNKRYYQPLLCEDKISGMGRKRTSHSYRNKNKRGFNNLNMFFYLRWNKSHVG
ncbi:Uncharacterised protein [Bartonella vinsonii]|uniref:Uncharacterized protein n=1 Tax=Bartonella vinsonii TaxID=33047 RepID=A0A448V3M5_BARVI|nr:Uncharacterised protein [Bartonella vinsonii]